MKKIQGEINRDVLPPAGFTDYLVILDKFDKDNRLDEDRLEDKKEREFLVKAILSKDIKFTKNIDLEIDKGSSFLIDNTGAVRIQIDNSFGSINCLKNEFNEIFAFESSIKSTDANTATQIFNKSLYPFVDFISFYSNTPIIISKISCLDLKNNVRIISYSVPYQDIIINPHFGTIYQELMPIFALYREAKNNHSHFYKFLCYYKILEGIFRSIRPARIHKIKKTGKEIFGYEENVPFHKDISDKHSELIGKKIQNVFNDFFTNEFRNVVAHFILKDGRVLNVSEYKTNEEFNNAVLLLELCVRIVIENEIKYLKI